MSLGEEVPVRLSDGPNPARGARDDGSAVEARQRHKGLPSCHGPAVSTSVEDQLAGAARWRGMHAERPHAADAVPAVTQAHELWETLGEDLTKLDGTPTGDALRGVYRRANGDLERFRHDAEAWFDDQMERLSGQYRRWVAWINLALGAGLILALNANAIRIAQLLWSDPTVRSAVVSNTGATGTGHQTSGQAIKTLQNLPLPLGWSGGWAHSGYHLWLPLLYAILGGLLSLAAVSLGAPFWFDTLSQLARLRTTGAPPAATGAVRRGEGDQRRVGPSMWPVAEPDAAAPSRSRRR
jgi:hypothetical protein